MTECIHYCDRCKARIESGRVKLAMECGPAPPVLLIDIGTGRPTIDLCPRCFNDLLGWLAAAREGE